MTTNIQPGDLPKIETAKYRTCGLFIIIPGIYMYNKTPYRPTATSDKCIKWKQIQDPHLPSSEREFLLKEILCRMDAQTILAFLDMIFEAQEDV